MSRRFFALAVALAVLTACRKEAEVLPYVRMTLHAGSERKTALAADGHAVLWHTDGEYLTVLEHAGGVYSTAVTSGEGTTSDGGATMDFSASFRASTDAPFDYYALYPSASFVSNNTDVENLKIKLPTIQYPTEGSFGQNADVLVSQPVTGLASQPTSLTLAFGRKVAIGKMLIKNLASAENIAKITLTVPGKVVTGSSKINLKTAETVEYGYSGNGVDKVVLDYDGQAIAANGMTAFFTAWPFSLAPGDSFTVDVETETLLFSRTVTIPEGRSLVFSEGDASDFSVSFTGVTGGPRAADLDYTALHYADFRAVYSSGSYGYATVTTEDGAQWQAYALSSTANSAIQLRNASSNNDSYLKLPDLGTSIRLVKLTISPDASGKNVSLETGATLKTGSIAKATRDGSGSLVFDIADAGVHTAYLRSLDAVLYLSAVEVYAGEETRPRLDAPGQVQAQANAIVPNAIDVSWTAVSGADSYVVEAQGTSATVRTEVTETAVQLSGLAYETEYTISVYAVTTDVLSARNSIGAHPSGTVTTGAQPSVQPTAYNWLELPAPVSGSGYFSESLVVDGTRNYTYLYEYATYASLWVAYPLCSSYMASRERDDKWLFNPNIDESLQVNVRKNGYGVNYGASEYARGHQVPNADRTADDTMNSQTFYLTNQTPQIQNGFNSGIWNSLEARVRTVATATDTVYVVTGACFRKVGGSETIQTLTATSNTILPASVPVPNYYWKALLKVKWNSGHTAVTQAKAVGVWLEHHAYSSGYNLDDYSVSVSQIQSWTGFDFFVNLPDSIEAAAENNADWTAFADF
ncbi:MAG: DNA/RNA non-specific endonuclease [Bacteroidales bacterium]|nr:DNA/RNA non-specific endonuclease [Bacteroidales bacterium]